MPEARVLTLRLDEETCQRLEERARAEEREVAQQARYFIKRGLLEDRPREPVR